MLSDLLLSSLSVPVYGSGTCRTPGAGQRRQEGRGGGAAVLLRSRCHVNATRPCWLPTHPKSSGPPAAGVWCTPRHAVQDIPAEWRMWLRKLREEPPSDEELQQ